jgi:hypothetical protein
MVGLFCVPIFANRRTRFLAVCFCYKIKKCAYIYIYVYLASTLCSRTVVLYGGCGRIQHCPLPLLSYAVNQSAKQAIIINTKNLDRIQQLYQVTGRTIFVAKIRRHLTFSDYPIRRNGATECRITISCTSMTCIYLVPPYTRVYYIYIYIY